MLEDKIETWVMSSGVEGVTGDGEREVVVREGGDVVVMIEEERRRKREEKRREEW